VSGPVPILGGASQPSICGLSRVASFPWFMNKTSGMSQRSVPVRQDLTHGLVTHGLGPVFPCARRGKKSQPIACPWAHSCPRKPIRRASICDSKGKAAQSDACTRAGTEGARDPARRHRGSEPARLPNPGHQTWTAKRRRPENPDVRATGKRRRSRKSREKRTASKFSICSFGNPPPG